MLIDIFWLIVSLACRIEPAKRRQSRQTSIQILPERDSGATQIDPKSIPGHPRSAAGPRAAQANPKAAPGHQKERPGAPRSAPRRPKLSQVASGNEEMFFFFGAACAGGVVTAIHRRFCSISDLFAKFVKPPKYRACRSKSRFGPSRCESSRSC